VLRADEEVHGFSSDRAEARAAGIFDVALRVLRATDADGVSPPWPPTGWRRSGWRGRPADADPAAALRRDPVGRQRGETRAPHRSVS